MKMIDSELYRKSAKMVKAGSEGKRIQCHSSRMRKIFSNGGINGILKCLLTEKRDNFSGKPNSNDLKTGYFLKTNLF